MIETIVQEPAAIEILGQNKVLTRAQAKGKKELPIRYFEDTLRQCAKENEEQGCDWRLVYLKGKSLRELRDMIGVDINSQPCFYKKSESRLEEKWAIQKFDTGYYLIDFKGRFPLTSWYSQGEKIAKLQNCERAPEAAVAEAVITNFKVHGERLLEKWYHWGDLLDLNMFRIIIGYFSVEGFAIGSDYPKVDFHPNQCVCLLRKFNH